MIKQILAWLPSRRWLVLPPILIGVVCVAAFAMSKTAVPRIERAEQALSLPVIRIQKTTVTPWATGFGTATPARTWAAITEIKGRIIATHPSLDSGTPIGKGELLIEIDDSDYQLRLSQRRAERNSMQAKLAELEAAIVADQASLKLALQIEDVAALHLKRLTRLTESNAASVSEVDSARTQLLLQSQLVQNLKNSLTLYPSKIASAKAGIAMVESQVEEAQRDVDRTKIVSPFAGVLSGVDLEPGQIVTQNQRLFEIQGNRVIEIESQFSLAQLEIVSPPLETRTGTLGATASIDSADSDFLAGLTAEVTLRSGDLSHQWVGKAIRMSESVDQQTRTLGIVIRVNNDVKSTGASSLESANGTAPSKTPPECTDSNSPQPTLRAGSFCEVKLTGRPLSDAIMVPRTAIDGDVVYLIDDQSRLRSRQVKTGFAIGEEVHVTAGLRTGDVVAIAYPIPAIEGKLVAARSAGPVPASQSFPKPADRNRPDAANRFSKSSERRPQ